jgi:2-polyprenyl-3-methyl-5-hydroxy-6-metoxy-1,4-benzoquinol methylase
MVNKDAHESVRAQYEAFPYPERNPLDELKRLNLVLFNSLDRVNHICHVGRKDFTNGARILVAGGGTGDAVIFLAEQLRESDSEVFYIDFSEASMGIAKERANIRGLDNIIWILDSILNIPSLNLGKFDYIVCSGVLHHLADPDKGLHVLESVLADDGAMTLMVYARYGRTVVYQIQELMRLINQNVPDMNHKLQNCRTVLQMLPDDHWFQFVKKDIANLQDIELYDLLLHSQDRPYTIPELYDLIEGNNLKIVRLLYRRETMGADLYDPRQYINDPNLLSAVLELDKRQQQAIAELMNGRILMHTCFAARSVNAQPDFSMLDYIPSFAITSSAATTNNEYQRFYQSVVSSPNLVVHQFSSGEATVAIKKTPNLAEFARHFDGKRALQEIYDAIIKTGQGIAGDLTYDSLSEEFQEMCNAMRKYDLLLLRHKSIPAYKTVQEMQQRMGF